MSDMDAVTDVTTLLKQAHDWGHPAMAVTDHGVVQAFTDANHYIESLGKDDPFKVIYGVEGYLVDDLTDVAVNEKGQSLDDMYVVFDLETTGFSPIKDRIIEIGAVKVEHGVITDKFSTFVNPKYRSRSRSHSLPALPTRWLWGRRILRRFFHNFWSS